MSHPTVGPENLGSIPASYELIAWALDGTMYDVYPLTLRRRS